VLDLGAAISARQRARQPTSCCTRAPRTLDRPPPPTSVVIPVIGQSYGHRRQSVRGGGSQPAGALNSLRSVYQVGDFLLLCHAARADNRYEHWISPLAADKAADKPADAEEGHGSNSPCLSVWKNRWVKAAWEASRAPAHWSEQSPEAVSPGAHAGVWGRTEQKLALSGRRQSSISSASIAACWSAAEGRL
jgi:hypothetical protein